jgi:hypothetical protein
MSTDAALRRLRAANPVPHPVAADADALFEQIARETPDARLLRERRRVRRGALVVAAVVVLAAVLASTAPALSNWIGDVIGRDEIESEYAQATHQLTLPPGYEWPRLAYPESSVASRGAGGSSAVLIAEVAWECYWARAIEERNGAAERRAAAALADLMANHIIVAPPGASENWTPPRADGKPVAVYADDGGYEYKRRMYAAAASGDATLVAQSCRANAPARWRR